MTSWPWMKDVEEAITSSPIMPVTKDDCRPLVKDLIEQHRPKIDKVQTEICQDALYDKNKHDDLWILRFVLSHKKTKPAVAAAKSTLAFRHKHKLDDEDIRKVPPHKKTEGLYANFAINYPDDAARFTLPDHQRGVVAFVKLSVVDYRKLVANVTVEQWERAFVYFSEWSFQWVDYITRTTGRLTKTTRFVDIGGLGLTSIPREGLKRDGDASATTEDAYPQLLEKLYLCNPPGIFHILWRVARTILPTRVVSKMDVIDPAKNAEERMRLRAHISDENLPSILGGQNKHHLEWNDEY